MCILQKLGWWMQCNSHRSCSPAHVFRGVFLWALSQYQFTIVIGAHIDISYYVRTRSMCYLEDFHAWSEDLILLPTMWGQEAGRNLAPAVPFLLLFCFFLFYCISSSSFLLILCKKCHNFFSLFLWFPNIVSITEIHEGCFSPLMSVSDRAIFTKSDR